MDSIAILDFGSQYSQLIARRVREANIYCQLFPHDAPAGEVLALNPAGYILSGGPSSVYDPGAPGLPAYVLEACRPVLGICYGMHILAHALGGYVAPSAQREYGRAEVRPQTAAPTSHFQLPTSAFHAWMSHGDEVRGIPAGFTETGRSQTVPFTAIENPERRLYGIQFHPEVQHTQHGERVLRNFLYDICGCGGDWTMASFLEEAIVLARAGAISLLPDHVIARPGYAADRTPLNTQQIDVLVQQVIDMRRAVDLLLARADVDRDRLAYVGHSCNAEIGAFLSGIDRRSTSPTGLRASTVSTKYVPSCGSPPVGVSSQNVPRQPLSTTTRCMLT